MVIKMLIILILMFDKANMSELECYMDGMDVIFKLATCPSSMSLLFPSNFRFKNSSHRSRWDRRDLQTGNF